MGRNVFLLVTYVLVVSWQCGWASRILLQPVDHHSHVNMFGVTAQTLQEAGHNVTVLTTSRHRKTLEKLGVPGLIHEEQTETFSKDFYETIHETVFATDGNFLLKIRNLFGKMLRSFQNDFIAMMSNEDFVRMLDTAGYDLAIVDGFDLGRLNYIIPYRLGIPYMTLTARHDPWKAGVPSMPSVDPTQVLEPFTEDSTIFQRMKNLAAFLFAYFFFPPASKMDELLPIYAPNRPPTTLEAVFRRSEMWLVNMETMCLDRPKMHGFHYQFISCVSCAEAKPLPNDMEDFVAGAKHGVVVVSFGSALKRVTTVILDKMLMAFASLDQRVLMRHDGELPAEIPSNVRIMKWLPQNDLLGHNNTRLFITHAGNNGQLESLHHGVPMLAMPLFGDQKFNAARSTNRGYGLTLDIHSFTSSQLLDAMNEMLTNPKYTENIRNCSARVRSFPTAQVTTRFWVEHVLQYGGQHLKPITMDMPLWKVFMLDVLGLVLVFVHIVIFCIARTTRWLKRRCCDRSAVSQLKKTQ